MKKKSSYQKLKEANADLRRQLVVVSTESSFMESENIKAIWRFRHEQEKTIMRGDRFPIIKLTT